MSICGSTTAASRLWREARKYEAQPVSSCRNCLKYMWKPPPWSPQWYPRGWPHRRFRARGASVRYARAVRRFTVAVLLALAVALPLVALAQDAPTGYPGQSNLVPPGMPTPTTAFERLSPGGPARDPGDLAWAVPGSYLGPATINSFSSRDFLATTYYFYWHDYTDPDRRARSQGRFHSPPDLAHYSFVMPETHQREFSDIL